MHSYFRICGFDWVVVQELNRDKVPQDFLSVRMGHFHKITPINTVDLPIIHYFNTGSDFQRNSAGSKLRFGKHAVFCRLHWWNFMYFRSKYGHLSFAGALSHYQVVSAPPYHDSQFLEMEWELCKRVYGIQWENPPNSGSQLKLMPLNCFTSHARNFCYKCSDTTCSHIVMKTCGLRWLSRHGSVAVNDVNPSCIENSWNFGRMTTWNPTHSWKVLLNSTQLWVAPMLTAVTSCVKFGRQIFAKHPSFLTCKCQTEYAWIPK